MKITALVALAANFLPAALGADFALYYSTHDASWEDRTGSDRLLGNTNLFPGKHTEVPAGGKPTDVQLNDGQGNRLKTLGGVPFTKSYREHSWLITTGSTTINVSVIIRKTFVRVRRRLMWDLIVRCETTLARRKVQCR